MRDRELSHIGTVGVISVLMAFLLVLAFGGCAVRRMPLGHSETWRECASKCDEAGGTDATVVENAHGLACVCAKKAEPTFQHTGGHI